jgi:hypothetical protein
MRLSNFWAEPSRKGEVSMYLARRWYSVDLESGGAAGTSVIDRLDGNVLQQRLLAPILGIKDVRVDTRIDFVGGARGTKTLEQLVDSGRMAAAFSMYPVSIAELTDVSEATLAWLINQLEKIGAPKGSKLILANGREIPFGVHQGLALFLNGMDLPDEVYANSDINHVIEECERLMEGGGKMLSFWEGSQDTALYFYGISYVQMKTAIAPFVATYPLCQQARIEQIA